MQQSLDGAGSTRAGNAGNENVVTVVHHLKPYAQRPQCTVLADDVSNWLGLVESCHANIFGDTAPAEFFDGDFVQGSFSVIQVSLPPCR
jgi:hypothetical protein